MIYDGYVHGAYETTMDLFDQSTGSFAMRGHPDTTKREEFIDAVYQKLPEVIVANHAKMKVLAFSIITDLGVLGKIVEVSHEEVQEAAKIAQPMMAEIMRTIIQRV